MLDVVKRNKRLWILDRNGDLEYTPPDFVQVKCRDDMTALAREIERIGFIPAIAVFEHRHQRRR